MPQLNFEHGVKLSNYTTFRIGGPADTLVNVSTAEEVTEAIWHAESHGLPWHVIGHGSNILVSDEGFAGAIIVFKNSELPKINKDRSVTASGGLALNLLVNFMAENGLAGLENLTGIPGTIGGAICGNAGAYGTSISDRLISALVLDRTGGTRQVAASELAFSYRTSILKETNEVVLEAKFSAEQSSAEVLRSIIAEKLADRSQKHPDYSRVPTAGSYFKNPAAKDGSRIAAGRLIEDAGCRELKVGGARLWTSHANIIVTDGKASSNDVRTLAQSMTKRVQASFGVKLVPEVVYLE